MCFIDYFHTRFVVFKNASSSCVQGTSDFCVIPDKFIMNQTKDLISSGELKTSYAFDVTLMNL